MIADTCTLDQHRRSPQPLHILTAYPPPLYYIGDEKLIQRNVAGIKTTAGGKIRVQGSEFGSWYIAK